MIRHTMGLFISLLAVACSGQGSSIDAEATQQKNVDGSVALENDGSASASGDAGTLAAVACYDANPVEKRCNSTLGLRCTTDALDCTCGFPGQSGPDSDGTYFCKHKRARELVGVVAGSLAFSCQPPRPGANHLVGDATITFDNRSGTSPIPFSLSGVNVVLDAKYTFSAGVQVPSDVKPNAAPGEVARVTRTLSAGTVFDTSRSWAAANGVDTCTYCGRVVSVSMIANVLGENFEVPATNVVVTCAR